LDNLKINKKTIKPKLEAETENTKTGHMKTGQKKIILLGLAQYSEGSMSWVRGDVLRAVKGGV
jgi:hypothetical protein